MKNNYSDYQLALVVESLDFAKNLAKKVGKCIQDSPFEHAIELSDLEQESVLALFKAAEHYDSSKEVKFQDYAKGWCKKYILTAIRKYCNPLSVPDECKDDIKILHLDLAFADTDIVEDEQLLYEITQDDDEEESLIDRHINRVSELLQILTPQERTIIVHFYGLNEADELSRKEIAGLMGLTPERVRQLQERALRKMERACVA